MTVSKFQKDSLIYVITLFEKTELLKQIELLEIEEIEHTGVGCIYSYRPLNLTEIQINNNLILGAGCMVYNKEIENGASITVNINNGQISSLEFLAHGTNFPTEDLTNYKFDENEINIIHDKNK
jgi:hypothetical protein